MDWKEIFSDFKIVEGARAEEDRPDKDPNGPWKHIGGRFIKQGSVRITDWRAVYGKLLPHRLEELIDKASEIPWEGWRKSMPIELDSNGRLSFVVLGDRVVWFEKVEGIPAGVAKILNGRPSAPPEQDSKPEP